MKCPVCNGKGEELSVHANGPNNVCTCCGFKWVFPQPDNTELDKIYNDAYFRFREGRRGNGDYLKMKTSELYMASILKYCKNGKILELGCGEGQFLEVAVKNGFSAVGYDYSKHAIEVAKRRFGGAAPVSFHAGPLAGQEHENSYDVAVLFDVLEHIRNPLKTLGDVQRLLKKGGIVVIATPATDSASAVLMGKQWMEYKREHLSYFNQENLGIALAKNGFQVEEIGVNHKVLNLEYIRGHFRKYPVQGITTLLNALRSFLPRTILHMPFKVVPSGIFCIARKVST